jgi:alpha/beta superfamily hydrolase
MPGAVVCHPHPLYGGSMDNNVVCGLVEALLSEGVATLRFNFRGVAGSGGRHGGGEAEVEDVRAALDTLVQTEAVAPERLAVFGYSFGAWVGLRAGCADPRVRALAAVAPPLAVYTMDFLATCPMPKLAVAGTDDAFCPSAAFHNWYETLAEPKSRVPVEGADHFFFSREGEVGAAAASFAREWLNPDKP